MTEDAGGARFLREAVAQLGRVVAGPEQFDGDVAADAWIAGAEQRTHATLPDQVDDLVASERFGNLHAGVASTITGGGTRPNGPEVGCRAVRPRLFGVGYGGSKQHR